MKTKKKVIVFGATGHVGSYLTLYAKNFFNQDEFEVIASGRRETKVFVEMGVPYYSVDITKEEDFEKLPTDNVYAVILLAGAVPIYMEGYEPKLYLDSIIDGGYNVLEYCRRVSADRILYSQTSFDMHLYPDDYVIKPNEKPNYGYSNEHTVYVIAKNAMLELLEHYYQTYNLKKFIFRLTGIQGYTANHYFYLNGEKVKRPIYQLIEKAQKGETLEVWGDPNYAKDLIHVYDCSQMFCKAVLVDKETGFYNVGTGMPVTIEEQIKTIAEVFAEDKKSEIVYCPEKALGKSFRMDIQNAIDELGYKPEYNCRKLFENFKKEMELDRFKELRNI